MLTNYRSLKNITVILLNCFISFFSNRKKVRIIFVSVLSVIGVCLPIFYAVLFQVILSFFLSESGKIFILQSLSLNPENLIFYFLILILFGVLLITAEFIFQKRMLLENIRWQINNQINCDTQLSEPLPDNQLSLNKSNKSAFLIGRILTTGTKDISALIVLFLIVSYFDFKLAIFMFCALLILVPFLFSSISNSITEKKSTNSLLLTDNLKEAFKKIKPTPGRRSKLEKDLLNVTRNNRQYIGVVQSYFISNLLVILSIFLIFIYLYFWNSIESSTKLFVIILTIFFFRSASSLTKLLSRILRNWQSIKSLSIILNSAK